MNLKLTLNLDRLFKVDHMVADPNPYKLFPKTATFSLAKKISALALHTGSLDPGFALLVKSQKFDRKIDFF
jgi:hypothetical protein